MTKGSNAIRLLAIAIIFAGIAAAGVAFLFVRADVDTMRAESRENLLWSSSQLEIEYFRFMETLARFGQAENAVDSRAVNERFDILWSRVTLFQHGDVGKRLNSYPQASETMAQFFATLQAQDVAVVGLKDGDKATAADIAKDFQKHASALRRFNRDVLHGEERRAASLREELYSSSVLLTWLSIGAAVISLALIYMFAAETRRHRMIAAENQRLFQNAEAANRTKSQFLTMMSHDLRTPMNGILGMIALAKQHGVSMQQARLLDQAADSSRQMNDLLTDILDFASLEDRNFELVEKPFEVEQLRKRIMATLQPVARREGIEIDIVVAPDCPAQLQGDTRRLRQAIVHLAAYLAATAGTKSVHLLLDYDDGAFQVLLSYVYGEDDADWRPTLILGDADRGTGTFASDALGPAVARGFIERMGGSIRLHCPDAGREQVAILLTIPMPVYRKSDIVVRIETSSLALSAICRSALGDDHVRFYSAGYGGVVNTVVIEAGSEHELQSVEKMKALYPGAVLVALGHPSHPELFDDEISLPINVDIVRSAPFLQLAS